VRKFSIIFNSVWVGVNLFRIILGRCESNSKNFGSAWVGVSIICKLLGRFVSVWVYSYYFGSVWIYFLIFWVDVGLICKSVARFEPMQAYFVIFWLSVGLFRIIMSLFPSILGRFGLVWLNLGEFRSVWVSYRPITLNKVFQRFSKLVLNSFEVLIIFHWFWSITKTFTVIFLRMIPLYTFPNN